MKGAILVAVLAVAGVALVAANANASSSSALAYRGVPYTLTQTPDGYWTWWATFKEAPMTFGGYASRAAAEQACMTAIDTYFGSGAKGA